jgi:hypothetical protein
MVYVRLCAIGRTSSICNQYTRNLIKPHRTILYTHLLQLPRCRGSATNSKVTEYFEVIKDELCKSDVLPNNHYNMDETGIMLSMLGAIKVFVGKVD